MKKELQEKMKLAMKAKEKLRVETIRSILSEMQYLEMQKGVETLNNDDSIAILQREIKKRKEELEFLVKSGDKPAIEKVTTELKIVEEFLPKQLTKEELVNILKDFKLSNANLNMGQAMKYLKDTFAGQYDGKVASEAVKDVL